MSDEPTEFGSTKYGEVIDEAYDEALLKSFDILARDDFYGIVAWRGMRSFGEKVGLTRARRSTETAPRRIYASRMPDAADDARRSTRASR